MGPVGGPLPLVESQSHRSRPDRLTFENLTALVTSGVKVGFHGHVHKSHAQLHRFITDDFALVSTGTLGAAADDRPDAVANQFSIVDLHRNRLRVAAHIFYLADAKQLVGAGVDALAHSVRDQPVDRELIDSMKKHRTWQAAASRPTA